MQASGPVVAMRISGLVRFGSAASLGGATLAGFALPTAQRLFGKLGKLDDIRVSAKPGVSPQRLVAQIRPVLPRGTQVRTGSQEATKDASSTTSFLSFLKTFLLVFAGVALFVGSFVIANSLSITIAQRTREFATLRTLGASRRQVLRAILLESLAVGIVASVIGLLVGLALAQGLFALFNAVGLTLPNSGTVVKGRTIVVAIVVGVVATALGFVALVLGLFVANGTGPVLALMGTGALLVFVGVALLSARIVPPLATWLGWPATKLAGPIGRLACENARRNPQRTASTASALMIGLALVTLVAILSAGIISNFRGAVNDLWRSGSARSCSAR